MTGRMSRTKGANAERAVVNWLRSLGHEARRYLAGDGNQPGDIDAIPGVCIEVKDQATYNIPAWLRQAIEEAGPDRLPVLIVKPKGVGYHRVGDWWCIMRFSDALPLITGDDE